MLNIIFIILIIDLINVFTGQSSAVIAQACKLAVAMMTFEYKLHSFKGLYATRVGTTAWDILSCCWAYPTDMQLPYNLKEMTFKFHQLQQDGCLT